MISEYKRNAMLIMLYRVFYAALDRLSVEYSSRDEDLQAYVSHMLAVQALTYWYEDQARRLMDMPLTPVSRHLAPPLEDEADSDMAWIFAVFGWGPRMNFFSFGIECLPEEMQAMLGLATQVITLSLIAGMEQSLMLHAKQLADMLDLAPKSGAVGLGQGAALKPKPIQKRPPLDVEGITRLANSVVGICTGRDKKPQGKKKRLPKPMP